MGEVKASQHPRHTQLGSGQSLQPIENEVGKAYLASLANFFILLPLCFPLLTNNRGT